MNPIKITLLGIAGLAPATISATDHTNFVIIHLDDMGYGDLSVTGATGYRTPNIDRLCTEGMRFTNFYSAQAVSSASRAGLLTGCYPNRIGFKGALNPNSETGLSPREETIATMLKKSGYACSAVGKWHLGDAKEFMPLQHGFDEYFGLLYSNDMWPYHPTAQYPPLPLIENNDTINPDMTGDDQKLLTTQYTERAVGFIRKNKDKPFFLYLAHSMPHVPLYVSDKFEGKSRLGLYGDVMMELDWSVGEILKTLEENGLDGNTLLIFLSDNGPWINYGNHAGSTGGLREGKGGTFEGGQRVPCIVRWPGKTPAGTINNNLASSIDILPTIAGISEAKLPSLKIDGIDIADMLTGNFTATPRKYFLYYYKENDLEAIRNSDFKLIFEHSGRTYEAFPPENDGKPGRVIENNPVQPALYDLRRDPGERYDVSELYPEVVEELKKIADEARDDLGDRLTNNPGKSRRPIGRVNSSKQ